MADFVIYTGPSVSQDSRTRKMIRSRAMLDFRRRQRSSNIRAFRDLVTDNEMDTGKAPKSGRQEESPKQRLHNAMAEMDHPLAGSSSHAKGRFLRGLDDTTCMCLSRPPIATSYNSSTTSTSTSPSFANHGQVSVNNNTHGAAAIRANRSHYMCENCLSQVVMDVPDLCFIEDTGVVGKPIYSISTLASRDPHEQMALQYFHSIVAKDVSGPVIVGFWEQLVPQMCEMEDTARQVAIALSQAHRERVTMILSPQHNSSQSNFGAMFSAESALKASRALRKYIETSPSPSYELVLTCSIMFYTIESMFGREASAVLHLENSLKMFNTWQRARRQAGRKSSETAFHFLAVSLARLDVSLTIANDKRIPVFEHEELLPVTKSLETLVKSLAFTNPHDAHFQLNRITTPAAVFVIGNHHWRGKYARDIPGQLVEEHRMLQRQFRAWDMAMSIYESNRLRHSDYNRQRVEEMSLLASRIVHWSAEKVVEEFVRDDDDTSPWDWGPPKLLTYTSDLLDYRDQEKLADGHLGHPIFSPQVAESGFLLMLAHRTALPHIRAEALRIAQRFGRKEGVRDLVGAFIEWTRLPVPRPPFPFLLGTPGH